MDSDNLVDPALRVEMPLSPEEIKDAFLEKNDSGEAIVDSAMPADTAPPAVAVVGGVRSAAIVMALRAASIAATANDCDNSEIDPRKRLHKTRDNRRNTFALDADMCRSKKRKKKRWS